jgi:hypothetical protein
MPRTGHYYVDFPDGTLFVLNTIRAGDMLIGLAASDASGRVP